MSHRFNVVFSGDFLLRDAAEGEPATAGGKRWTEGFHARSVGHNNYGWPVFAVTSNTAQALADWSVRYRQESFRQCRTWLPDDTEAHALVASQSALYDWNGCYLTSSWRSQSTSQSHYGRAVQLHAGLHLVEGHSWMAVDAHLVDVVHGAEAVVEPVWLRLTASDLDQLGNGSQLTVATFDGTPANVSLHGHTR